MPTRADWEAAVPKCPQRDGRSNLQGRLVAGHASTICYQPLHWNHASEYWGCAKHGRVLNAEAAVERRRAAENTASVA
jgi:hypothetical protein